MERRRLHNEEADQGHDTVGLPYRLGWVVACGSMVLVFVAGSAFSLRWRTSGTGRKWRI